MSLAQVYADPYLRPIGVLLMREGLMTTRRAGIRLESLPAAPALLIQLCSDDWAVSIYWLGTVPQSAMIALPLVYIRNHRAMTNRHRSVPVPQFWQHSRSRAQRAAVNCAYWLTSGR